MNKLLWIGLAIVLVGVILYGNINTTKLETEKPIVKIGVLAPLSGEFGFAGQDVLNGIKLAKEEFDNQNNDFVISLEIKDGKGLTSESLSAFQQLLFQKIDASIVMGDYQTMAAAPLIVSNKIPTVLTLVGDSAFESQNKERYMFLNFLSGKVAGRRMGKYAKDKGLKRVVTLTLQSPEPMGLLEGFKQSYGLELLSEDFYDTTSSNIRTQVLKIISKNPDAVYVLGYGTIYYAFINALKEQGYKGVIMSNASIIDPQGKEITNTEDILYSQAKAVDLEQNPKFNEFEKKYTTKYNKESTMFARYGYDTMNILIKGIQNGGIRSENIHQGLLKIKEFETFAGKLEFLPDGSSQLPTSIYKVSKDGTSLLVED